MTTPAPFALYAKPACSPEDSVSAGATLNLYTPVQTGSATLFRRSLWLPIPAAARLAKGLDLGGSTLALRFAPADIEVGTGDTDWFNRAQTPDNRTVDLEFVWPAPVRRFRPPAGFTGIGLHLHRVDGEHVAEEASQSGSTGGALNPPWVGSPVQVRLDAPIAAKLKLGLEHGVQATTAKAGARAAGGSPVSEVAAGGAAVGIRLDRVIQSHVIPAVVLAGVPSSPRAKLFLESLGEERLLWQGLVPGEQAAAVTLPAQPLAGEWSAALEQVVAALAADAGTGGALLRLDVESDAPCALTLQEATLALTARYALAPEPARVDFDGSQAQSTPIALGPLPAGTPQALTLAGRVEGGDGPAPAAAAGEAGERRGILLSPDEALVLAQPLPAPAPLAGLGLLWHPLSDRLKGRVAVLADGGTGPGRPLLEQNFELATPAPGWLALRWPAVDVQTQTLWLKLAVEEGMGLWLAPADAAPPAGWKESAATGRLPLALAPAAQWLAEGSSGLAGGGSGGLVFSLGGQTLSAQKEGVRLTLALPATALPALAIHPLEARCAAPARLTIEEAELTVLL